jgi:hypothetical protein
VDLYKGSGAPRWADDLRRDANAASPFFPDAITSSSRSKKDRPTGLLAAFADPAVTAATRHATAALQSVKEVFMNEDIIDTKALRALLNSISPGIWTRNGAQIISLHRDCEGFHETLICDLFVDNGQRQSNAKLIETAPLLLKALLAIATDTKLTAKAMRSVASQVLQSFSS